MKHVTKRDSPSAFEDWKALANANWAPSYGGLQNPEKHALHTALLAEQGGVCCYCGRSISLQDSHIEHFRPQEHYGEGDTDLTLDYSNLHASCIRETQPGTPLHCGHAKGAAFDEALHISPQDAQCETRFSYTSQGDIIETAKGDTQASYMLNLLKLDIATLCNHRKEAISRVFDPTFLDSATEDEFKRLRDAYRRRNAQGQTDSFGHVLARFAEQRLLDATP